MPGIMYVMSIRLDSMDEPRQRSRASAYAPAAAPNTPIAVATIEIRMVFLYHSPNWVSSNNLVNCWNVQGWGHRADVMDVIWFDVLKADTKAKKNGNSSNSSKAASNTRLSVISASWPAFFPASDSSSPRRRSRPVPLESAL